MRVCKATYNHILQRSHGRNKREYRFRNLYCVQLVIAYD